MTKRSMPPAQPAGNEPPIDAPQDPAQSPSTREDDIAGSEGCGGNVGRGGYRDAEGPDREQDESAE